MTAMLHRLRERVEVFLESVARDRCRYELEDRPDVRIGARYARARDVFARERILDVQRALSGASGAEERRLRFLLEFLAFGYARCAASEDLDRLRAWEGETRLTVRGQSVAFRAVRSHQRGTADRLLREELEEARLAAIDEQFPVVEAMAARQRDAVEELGYGSFLEGSEVLSGIDLRGLGREGERFLSDTDAAYRELLAWYLPRLAGAEPAEAGEGDAARLEEAGPFSAYFGDFRLLARVQEALAGLGLDPAAEGRLRTATLPRLPAGTGAVCCAVRVPDEVLLTVAEQPGRAAGASLLRALGLAVHRAFTAPGLPVELRRLGDDSVPLGFGRMLEGLLATPSFLARACGIPRSSLPDYLRLAALLELMRARRDVGVLQLQLSAYAEADWRETVQRYVDVMGPATGLRQDPRAAFWSLRAPFQVARTLRAAQLGALLRAQLRERFDEDWWRNPRSGGLIRDLAESGQSYTAPEISVQLASRPLSFQPLRETLEEHL